MVHQRFRTGFKNNALLLQTTLEHETLFRSCPGQNWQRIARMNGKFAERGAYRKAHWQAPLIKGKRVGPNGPAP